MSHGREKRGEEKEGKSEGNITEDSSNDFFFFCIGSFCKQIAGYSSGCQT